MVASVQNPIPIPEPTNDVDSLWSSVKALKECVETMQGMRGMREYALLNDVLDRANDFQEQLKALDLIAADGATQLDELTDVNTSTPTNRHALVADGVDWESRLLVEADISDLSHSVGVQGMGIWRYRTETVTPPASGQLRFNNADVSLATEFYLHETTDEGTDVSAFLELLLQDGSALYMQDKTNAANHVIIEISSSVDSGTYRTYGIQSISESGTEPGQNTQVVLITGGTASAGIAPGTSTDNVLRWSGSAWVETSGATIGATGALTALTYGGILESNLVNAALDGEIITGDWNFTGDQDFWAPVRIGNAGQTDYITFSHNGTDFNMAGTLTAGLNITGITLLTISGDLTTPSIGPVIAGTTYLGPSTGGDHNFIFRGDAGPGFFWQDNNAAADEKVWRHDVFGGNLRLMSRLDDLSGGTEIYAVHRGVGALLDDITFGVPLHTSASATGAAGFRLPEGVAPTSPVDGDMWVTTTDVLARINGVSESLIAGIAAGTVTDSLLRWSGSAWVEVTAAKITATGGLTALTYGGILEGNLTNANAAQIISGAWNFTGSTDFWSSTRIGNPGQTDYMTFSHNGTDFNMVGFQTGKLNITGITALDVVNYDFDVDQAVGAGQDNYVLTYDNADGQISLEVSTGVAAGTVTDALLRWSGSAWVEVTGAKITATGALTAVTYAGILGGNLTNANSAQIISGAWNFTGSTDFWSSTRIGNPGQTDYMTFSHNGTDFNMAGTLTTDINITGVTNVNLNGTPFATTATNWSAADITSGTLAVARGGTGVTTSTGTGSTVRSASPNFTGQPDVSSLAIPFWATAGQTSGDMTISTSVASGGANGDIHFRY